MQRNNYSAPPLVIVGILLLQAAGDRVHIGLRLLQIDAGLEAGDDDRVVLSSHGLFFVGPRHGRPHFRKVGEAEAARHDASDEDVVAVEVDLLIYDGGIGAKLLLPQAVTQNHDIGVTGLIFLGRKLTA